MSGRTLKYLSNKSVIGQNNIASDVQNILKNNILQYISYLFVKQKDMKSIRIMFLIFYFGN